MATPSSPTTGNFNNSRRRTNTNSSIAQSVASVSQSAVSFTEDLVLHRDPPLGFFAAAADATSTAAVAAGEIRRGSFGQDGWQAGGSGSRTRRSTRSSGRRQSTGSKERSALDRDAHGVVEPFAPLTEEPTRISTDVAHAMEAREVQSPSTGMQKRENTLVQIAEPTASSSAEHERSNHDRIPRISKDKRIYSSGYIPPPKIPWTASTAIGLRAFWKWFCTPFGFFLTIYGLNVVAWGGMLFLLLCNASKYMCWAPVPNAQNKKHLGDIAALNLPGPYYFNCNDINSSRRIWLEIDCQIVNALFCVTGFGLVPWRFRDLYYLLKWRLTSESRSGRERKMYGLRVLAGIHKSWFRLPGSETLDLLSTREYLAGLEKPSTLTTLNHSSDIEASLSSQPESDPRIPLPISKRPSDPPTSIRAPPTKPWKLDCFIWCQVWNTFFQCGLCGFMWGMDRYTRPPWSTGLFIALACIIAGWGGVVSFIEGKNVKKVEGVAAKVVDGSDELLEGDDNELKEIRTDATGHESIYAEGAKRKSVHR